MDDFRDFYSFCERIDHWGMRSGIVKVVPPAEWTGKLPKLDEGEVKRLRAVRIKNSISQMFSKAGGGAFHQKNIVHPAKVVNAKQWADLCASKEQRGPDMERMKGNARAEAKARKQELRMGHFAVPTDDNDDDDDDGEQKEEDGVRTRSGGTPSRETAKHGQKAEGKVKMADRTTEAEWNAFDYENGWCHEAGPKATADDWKDEEVCRAIEKEYWSGLIWGKPPMYGADLEGTLFTDETKDWNVGHLDNVLTRLKLKHRLKGVTTPYLYFGMWRATFAWHVEDVDLYSINYIHFGAPKQWYSIRQSDRQRFELAMAGAFPGDSSRCRHFMRHKSYLASPSFLASNNIKPLRLVQHAGEFVITYPYGYHSGYNLGFNCAESLNFALESWIPIGRRAGHCLCDPDAVHMDIDALLEESAELEEMERRREERQRGQVEHEARLEDNCVFCPYNLDDDLVPLRADAKARYAHRFCTNFMPECWVGEDDDDDRGPGEVVMGFDSINKARWSLKCQLCATPQLAKKGAKVQCTYSKCSRTTHAACALKDTSGWLLDVVGDRAADRLEGKTTGTDEIEEDDEEPTRMVVLCKQHNPEQKQREAVRKALVLKACVTRLKEGQNVRVRTSRGVWMTVLVEV
ncbi:JmjC-domain-containing protein, partial [Acaromyces ingoldii]